MVGSPAWDLILDIQDIDEAMIELAGKVSGTFAGEMSRANLACRHKLQADGWHAFDNHRILRAATDRRNGPEFCCQTWSKGSTQLGRIGHLASCEAMEIAFVTEADDLHWSQGQELIVISPAVALNRRYGA